MQLSAANYNTNENPDNFSVTANLSSTSAVPVTVQYATSDDSAIAGKDYTATNGTLTIPAGRHLALGNGDGTVYILRLKIPADK